MPGVLLFSYLEAAQSGTFPQTRACAPVSFSLSGIAFDFKPSLLFVEIAVGVRHLIKSVPGYSACPSSDGRFFCLPLGTFLRPRAFPPSGWRRFSLASLSSFFLYRWRRFVHVSSGPHVLSCRRRGISFPPPSQKEVPFFILLLFSRARLSLLRDG